MDATTMLTHMPLGWQKERSWHRVTLVHPSKDWTKLMHHLRLLHPMWENLLFPFPDLISFAADSQPSIACSERWWAASSQTTALILFRQAARYDTPPASLNVDIAHYTTLLYLQSKHILTWVILTGEKVSFWMGWSWKPTRLSKFFSVKACVRSRFLVHIVESLQLYTSVTEQNLRKEKELLWLCVTTTQVYFGDDMVLLMMRNLEFRNRLRAMP